MSFAELNKHLSLHISARTLRRFLQQHSYRRYVAKRKPKTTPRIEGQRLRFALKHQYWTIEDWSKVLFTNETWVSSGSHKRVYMTRTRGEEVYKDCIDPKIQRQKS